MKNISQIKINQLMENLYIDAAINRIYEESSEFDWIRDINPISLDFNGTEYWIDVSDLSNEDKLNVGRYIRSHVKIFNKDWGIRMFDNFMSEPERYKGVIVHCGTEDYDFEPQEGYICAMPGKYEDDSNTQNSTYIHGSAFLSSENINESEFKGKDILKDIVKDLGLSTKFVFTFGTGIGAFMLPVKDLLEGSGLSFNHVEIGLLIITATAMMLNESNVSVAIEKLKEKGLYQYLKDVIKFITDTKNLINSITKNVANATYGLSDILAFTFLLVPSMRVITDLINDYGLSMDSVGQLFTGLAAGATVYGVKSVISKLKDKL